MHRISVHGALVSPDQLQELDSAEAVLVTNIEVTQENEGVRLLRVNIQNDWNWSAG